MPDSSRPTDPMNHVFPRSVLFASREEFGDREDTPNARSYNPQATHPPLKLRIREGNIPADLCGHVYIVGPVGSVDSLNIYGQADQSVVVPSLDGTTLLYNGDGMIYRLDFDQPKDGVYLSSRMVKTPCYYADAATHRCPDYQGKKSSHNPKFNKDLRFRNFGITRLSSFLGIRNQLNTAFLPMRFSEEDRDRLLVSWDMGRPYEIDPRTLETITPVGREIEWKEINPLIKSPHKPEPMFKTVQSCAHPSFDPHTGEVFNVNTGRSLANFFSQLLPVNRLLKPVIRTIQNQVKNRHRELIANGNKKQIKCFGSIYDALHEKLVFLRALSETTPGIIDLFQVMINFLTGNFRSVFDQDLEKSSENHHLKNFLLGLIKFFQAIFHFFKGDFLEILVWDGKHDLQRWQVTYSGKPVKIIQSTHQIGITEDYILIVDTAFKFAIKELLPSLKTKGTERIESLIREMLNRQQIPDNYVYIIPRSELFPGSMKVEAKRVVIPYEAAHFLVDYKNLDGQIRIHFSHVCGWDAAECITKFDFQDPSDSTSHISREQQQPLYGVLYGPTDVSRLGLYILDGKSGNIIESRKVETKDQGSSNPMNLAIESWAWGPAIFTYRSHSNYAPPNHIEDLYWGSLGCWEELLLPHITDLYEDYKYRELSLSTVQDIARQGRRSNIIHIHTEPPRTDGCSSHSAPQIVNAYGFPDGHYVTSPQFVPAKDRTGSTDGYIVCIVHYGDGSDRFEGENTNGNEIWIFDARTLDEPICKLYHPKLNIGFTVHGTWMAQAERRTAPYYISPEADYGPLLKDQGVEVKDLFERWVFPRKEPQAGDC